jgi:hypothetical protein
VLTPPVGRNVGQSIRQVQAFQLVRKSKGKETTPSGWKPGKATLNPDPDLVGKVWKPGKQKWLSTKRNVSEFLRVDHHLLKLHSPDKHIPIKNAELGQ